MLLCLYLYIQHVESHLFSYVIAFEPSRSHKAVILFLSHFLPLFWYCPTQYSHHLSLPNIYCTLRSESLHMKIISNLLNPKGLFNLWNLRVFEILTKVLLIMFSSLKNLLFHYICDTVFSWLSKFFHSYSPEGDFLYFFFFPFEIFLENLLTLTSSLELHMELQGLPFITYCLYFNALLSLQI